MAAHSTLTGTDLHECKGASTAALGKTPVADGAGAAAFKYANPRGAVYFVDTATPYTLTYPAAYTKAAPTTTAVGLGTEVTEATTARITYTGTDTLDVRIIVNVSLDQASGANRDIEMAIYKNGSLVAGSTIINTTSSAVKVLTTSIADTTAATNDYFECYMKNTGASGDIRIYSFYLTAFLMRG